MADLSRPSRDGDQFHYLWAARRCLALLLPTTDLVGISIEGASPDEARGASSASAPAADDVIDIAEYYGDTDPRRARRVCYTQLKHSTRHAARAWTASGLKTTLKGFAEKYAEVLQRFGVDCVSTRIEFRFVTNRPVSAKVVQAVDDAARGAVSRQPAELRKLERSTGFAGGALASFCSLLRFEDGQDGYWVQRNILSQEASGYLPGIDGDAPTQLKELVTRKALSESEHNPLVEKPDVLRALKTDEHSLYPAPCRITRIDEVVSREQEADLVREIVQADSRPVIVHALAGVGKSVFATRIQGRLPEQSVSILYDCFGSGEYRAASRPRHRHRDALVQIANELAGKGLCHPLVPTAHADATDYVRAFKHRLRQAVDVIRGADTRAVLCIVIDAADNAQQAAEENGQPRSFARDLLRETLPDGVRLVVLCRSHRQELLDPPPRAVRLELKTFTATETAAHLRQTFPDATDADVKEFHRLSSQNPRVQALALSRQLPSPAMLRELGPNPTTVDDAIENLLNRAIERLRDDAGLAEREQIDGVCAGLAVLRPLVPVAVLAELSGVSQEAVRSFALDFRGPLLVAGDAIQFRDEPVETWFRERFKPPSEEMSGFIGRLTPLAAGSAYVSATLPQLMLEAGQLPGLVQLALTSSALPETSEVERRAVELGRAQFALKAALRSRSYLDAARLALKAGEQTAGDGRQRRLIQSNTDLAALFLEPELVQEIVSRRNFDAGWRGSHHVYEAGLLSGCPAFIGEARSRLRMAYEWLDNRSRLSEDERQQEMISDEDIAELAMAEFNVHGSDRAARSIGRWRPRSVAFTAGRIVARRLIDRDGIADANALAEAAGEDSRLVLAVVRELREIHQTPSANVLERVLRRIRHLTPIANTDGPEGRDDAIEAVTALVEAALKRGLCSRDGAAELLARCLPATPPRDIVSRGWGVRSALLRAYSLRAALKGERLEPTDLAHPELRTELEKKSSQRFGQETEEFKRNVNAVLPWFRLCAAVSCGDVARDALPEQLRRARKASTPNTEYHHPDGRHVAGAVALVWFDVLNLTGATDAESVDAFAAWIGSLRRPLFTPTLHSLARLGARRKETRPLALQFASQAFQIASDERTDAEKKSHGYVDVARAVLSFSATEAKGYFDEAVAVASKVGDEAVPRWGAMLDLADRAGQPNRAVPDVAYRLARCAELTHGYVDDKYFDWDSTARALACLCPRSAFAILGRWRDRRFGWTPEILPAVMEKLIKRGDLDPRDALPLIGFDARWEYLELLDAALGQCASRAEMAAVATLLVRYAKFSAADVSTWERLRETVARHGLSVSCLDEHVALAERRDRGAGRQRPGQGWSAAETRRNAEPAWDEVFAEHDLAAVHGIVAAYDAFKRTPSPWRHEEFFTEAMRRVSPGAEAKFVTAVGEAPTFSLYSFSDFLEKVPEDWLARTPVRRSLEGAVKRVCRRYCMKVAKHRHYETAPFDAAFKRTGISEEGVVEVVLDAVGRSPELADSDRLFSLVGLLASKLTRDEALEALAFGLDLFEPVLEPDDGDGPWSDALAPPPTVEESLAGYVHAGLAAPTATVRWEAAHTVTGMCALGRSNVLGHLMSLADAGVGGPFADARLPFYRLHAFQWLMIGCARAATEHPAPLKPFASRFVDWALDGQSHVMIKQFAARTALALLQHGVLPAGEQLERRLRQVNVSSLPIMESNSVARVSGDSFAVTAGDDKDRSYFYLDIGPYWFKPLGRVFGLSQSRIETEALTVIRKELHHSTGEQTWREDERSRRDLYGREQTYASHGIYPATDNYQVYLSYHAMMIVAGRFLATTSTHHDGGSGDQDEFAEWLSWHDLARNDARWLADRRDPDPLPRPAWLGRKENEPGYGVITPADFEEALIAGGWLNVWGRWSTTDSTTLRTVSVASALVCRDRSHALLRALNGEHDGNLYEMPAAGYKNQIDTAGFVLKGWVEVGGSHEGLDDKDKWSGGVDYPPPRPATAIVELMHLKTDADMRVWRDTNRRCVMSSEAWGRVAGRDEDDNPERGERLRAALGFVTDLLGRLGLDLIVGVQIRGSRRYGRYEPRDRDDEQERTGTRHYRLGADGSVTSV